MAPSDLRVPSHAGRPERTAIPCTFLRIANRRQVRSNTKSACKSRRRSWKGLPLPDRSPAIFSRCRKNLRSYAMDYVAYPPSNDKCLISRSCSHWARKLQLIPTPICTANARRGIDDATKKTPTWNCPAARYRCGTSNANQLGLYVYGRSQWKRHFDDRRVERWFLQYQWHLGHQQRR